MSTLRYQLAQCHVSKLKGQLNDQAMREFFTFLEPVYQAADRADGFVWRLKDSEVAPSEGHSPDKDHSTIIDISIWRDIESLSEFTYGDVHNYFSKNRNKWMDKVEQVRFVMWWIPELHIPTIDEAKSKLHELELFGPTHRAFNWQQKFNPPVS